MPVDKVRCQNPDCKAENDGHLAHCYRCAHFIGFPNRRDAEDEQSDLADRYSNAVNICANRSLNDERSILEGLAEDSRPVISMSYEVCDTILRSEKYKSYYILVAENTRHPAISSDHTEREKVDTTIYPRYHAFIHSAVLSPNGEGLLSYGPVFVRWQVTSGYLEPRISLLEENSYDFFDRHCLGVRSAALPRGHRATWQDRAKLALAKVVNAMSTSRNEAKLASLILSSYGDRATDQFIEVAIYSKEGLDTEDVDMITFKRRPSTDEERFRIELIRQKCVGQGIEVVE